jgi:serine/threonine-protein kinase
MAELPPPARLPAPAPPPPPPWPAAAGSEAAGDPVGRFGVGPYAGFWRRVVAHLIDSMLYGLLLSPFVMAVYLSALRADDECYTLGREVIEVVCPRDEPAAGPRVVAFVVGALGVLFVTGIYLRALGRSGQTWGRRIARVRVVRSRTGEPIGFGRALGRQLFALVTRSLVLGYLWMLWDGQRQTWHDKVADTVVVES